MRRATYLYSWVGWAKSPQWWMLQNVTHSRLKAGLFSLSTAPCHWQIKIRWDAERLSGLCDLQGPTTPLLCLSVTSITINIHEWKRFWIYSLTSSHTIFCWFLYRCQSVNVSSKWLIYYISTVKTQHMQRPDIYYNWVILVTCYGR